MANSLHPRIVDGKERCPRCDIDLANAEFPVLHMVFCTGGATVGRPTAEEAA